MSAKFFPDGLTSAGSFLLRKSSSTSGFGGALEAVNPSNAYSGILTDSGGRGLRIATSDYNDGTNTGSVLQFNLGAGTGNTTSTIQAFVSGTSSATGSLLLNPNGGAVTIGASGVATTHTFNIATGPGKVIMGPGFGSSRPGMTVDNGSQSQAIAFLTEASGAGISTSGVINFYKDTYANVKDTAQFGINGTLMSQMSGTGTWILGASGTTSGTHLIQGNNTSNVTILQLKGNRADGFGTGLGFVTGNTSYTSSTKEIWQLFAEITSGSTSSFRWMAHDGGSPGSFVQVGTWTNAGVFTIGPSSGGGGVKLNNSTGSYTPATLDYYEELTISGQELLRGDNAADIEAGAQGTVQIVLRRIGKLVVCAIGRNTSMDSWGVASMPATTTIILGNGTIPTRFLNSSSGGYAVYTQIPVSVAGTRTSAYVGIYAAGHGLAGRVSIEHGANASGNFTSGNAVSFLPSTTLCWFIN